MTTKRREIVETTPQVTRDLSVFDDMDRLFDTVLHRGWMRPFHEMFPEWPLFGQREVELQLPRVDVIDREQEILVRAELPGVEKKDLEVNLTGQTLTIEGKTGHEEEETKGEYFRSEIRRGAFKRTIRLPDAVAEKKIKAEFKDGMLEVRMPKLHKAQHHQIPVE